MATGIFPAMRIHFQLFFLVFLLLKAMSSALAQCNPVFSQPLSSRPSNYDINVTLHPETHRVDATQTIRFQNQSPEPIRELRVYMYLNAFKNTESTFLSGTTQIFGQNFTKRDPSEWGWIHIDSCERENGADLTAQMRYVQPDDGNAADQSVLNIPLDKPIQPGETAVFNLKWSAQMPKTIARAGHSRDFYLFCHWFPQLGVFEQNLAGIWGWNCHQFQRHTEFYADFGVYDVRITTPANFVLGASGCLMEEVKNADGTLTRWYHVEDVIDFAWSVYPNFEVQQDRWKSVNIRLLIPPEHAYMGPRYIKALKFALEYMEKHVGAYPYPTITVVDPPFHGLHSGMMEYPTLITVATFYGMPDNVRTMESLVVHEFVHQYFMGMVASNEKEEAWLDEGFVTWFEDRIIDAAYGQKKSLVNLGGYHLDNRELTRTEYTTMPNPREGPIARPGWEFETSYKALIYSKTATTLRTIQALIGEEKMDAIMRVYFEKWKFKHPKGPDFMALLNAQLHVHCDSLYADQIFGLAKTAIYETAVLDYSVRHIENEVLFSPQGIFGTAADSFRYEEGEGTGPSLSRITVQRNGDWVFPVEIRVVFADGSSEMLQWSGAEGLKVFEIRGKPAVVSAQIDPFYKISLDADINNNSLTLKPDETPIWKYGIKAIFWVQNLFQMISFLM